MVRARPIPPLADRFIAGATPIDYGPELLLMPFGFHLTMDTLPSGDCKWWLQVRLGCIRLLPSCPFRLLHTFHSSGQRGYQPRFRIRCSSSEHRRDFNPPDQRAAQRTHIGQSEARGLVLSWVVREGIGLTQRLGATGTVSSTGDWHTHPRTRASPEPTDHHQDVPPEMEGASSPATLKRLAILVFLGRSFLLSSTEPA